MKSYDINAVSLIVGTRSLKGFGASTVLKASRDEDRYTKQVGASGEVTRSKTNNKSGTVEYTAVQSSDDNDYLSGLANTDTIFPITALDKNGTTVVFCEEAWIRKVADAELARDAGERTWVFDCAELELFVGGN